MQRESSPEQLAPEDSGSPDEFDIEALLAREDEAEAKDEADKPAEDEEQADDADPESDPDATEEETEAEPVASDWKHQEFEIDGKKVSGAELAAGYMKDADYRQKTAQAAQLRREAEQLIEKSTTELSQRAKRLEVLESALYKEIVGDQSQLSALVEQDPAEYLRRSHYLAQRNQLLQQAMAEREAVSQQQAQLSHRQMAEYVQEESQRLLEALPEWKDPKIADAERTQIAEYLLEKGYQSDELAELYDHRALVMARKAMLYDKRAALKPAIAKSAPSVTVKPGAPQQPQQSVKKREALRNRAIKSNDRDDWASAIEQYLS
jgi:hypothetical protein